MKKSIQELNNQKMAKWLDTKIICDGHIMTRRELMSNHMTGKQKSIQEYATKKINGYYSKLKQPKITYYIVYLWKGIEKQFKCPKYVWEQTIAVEL